MLRSCTLTCLVFGISVILHGCGGGGGGGTTTTSTTATTTSTTYVSTSTTTATTHAPVAPMPWGEALAELNDLYMGWDPKNKSTRYGVTVRFVRPVHILNDHDWFYCQDPCEKGWNDCRVSASLLNNHTMLRNKNASAPFNASMPTFAEGMDKVQVGVALNQTYVEEEAAKCYYQYDGATLYRYNHGCGCGADQKDQTCKSEQSAYSNVDPETGQQMNSNSDKVAGCHCGDGRYVRKPPPSKTTESQCFWKGPAFDPAADPVNEIDKMMAQRMKNQHGFDVEQGTNRKISRMGFWNEVVIDGNLLKQQLANDPSKVIIAVVYKVIGDDNYDQNSHDYGHKFAGYLQSKYGFTAAPPVIGFDTFTIDVTKRGPFFPHSSVRAEESVIA